MQQRSSVPSSLKKGAETEVTCFQKYPVGLKYTQSDTRGGNYRQKHRVQMDTECELQPKCDFKTESQLTLKAGGFSEIVSKLQN